MACSITGQEHFLTCCLVKDVSTHISDRDEELRSSARLTPQRKNGSVNGISIIFKPHNFDRRELNAFSEDDIHRSRYEMFFFFSFETWRSFHSAWMTLKEVKGNVGSGSFPLKVASLYRASSKCCTVRLITKVLFWQHNQPFGSFKSYTYV